VSPCEKLLLNPEPFRRQLRNFFSHQAAFWITALVLVFSVSAAGPQAESGEKSARKLVTQVEPDYPPDLKRAAIGGVVRLDIVVAPGGKVDNVIVTGGNPILAESATRAVKQWKYAPATTTTNIKINVRFDPHR
jgi:TonB family protein